LSNNIVELEQLNLVELAKNNFFRLSLAKIRSPTARSVLFYESDKAACPAIPPEDPVIMLPPLRITALSLFLSIPGGITLSQCLAKCGLASVYMSPEHKEGLSHIFSELATCFL